MELAYIHVYKPTKEHLMPATWKTIKDSNVRIIWAWPDGTHEVKLPPDYAVESGTPIVPEDESEEFGGDDMIYVRTEIKV